MAQSSYMPVGLEPVSATRSLSSASSSRCFSFARRLDSSDSTPSTSIGAAVDDEAAPGTAAARRASSSAILVRLRTSARSRRSLAMSRIAWFARRIRLFSSSLAITDASSSKVNLTCLCEARIS